MKQVDLYGNEPRKAKEVKNKILTEPRKKTRSEIRSERLKNRLCVVCGKPLHPPCAIFRCIDCLKYFDIKQWARILTRHYYGKAETCEKCGSTNRVQWHHKDYTKPREAIALCLNCHVEADKETGFWGREQPISPVKRK